MVWDLVNRNGGVQERTLEEGRWLVPGPSVLSEESERLPFYSLRWRLISAAFTSFREGDILLLRSTLSLSLSDPPSCSSFFPTFLTLLVSPLRLLPACQPALTLTRFAQKLARDFGGYWRFYTTHGIQLLGYLSVIGM